MTAGNSADDGATESGAAEASAGAAAELDTGQADDGAASAGAGLQAGAVQTEDAPEVLSVLSGNPTDEELAALTAVVVALQGTQDADEPAVQGRSWLRRAMLRLGPIPGPGSWRRSNR